MGIPTPKSAMQHMLESMLGSDGVKAVEECKKILPAVPQLIQNLKSEWEALKLEQQANRDLLQQVLLTVGVVDGKLENLAFKIDPNKTEELPPTLAHHLAQAENVEKFLPEESTQ